MTMTEMMTTEATNGHAALIASLSIAEKTLLINLSSDDDNPFGAFRGRTFDSLVKRGLAFVVPRASWPDYWRCACTGTGHQVAKSIAREREGATA